MRRGLVGDKVGVKKGYVMGMGCRRMCGRKGKIEKCYGYGE